MCLKEELRVKNRARIILCDNSIFITFSKIYVIHTLCDKATFACVIGIPCCVIKQFSRNKAHYVKSKNSFSI